MSNISLKIERARIKFQDSYFAFEGKSYSISVGLDSAEASCRPGTSGWALKTNGLSLTTEVCDKKAVNIILKVES